jgi:formate hydrogenlyase subunit 3/multisubunit Na+/H+ antiporter MnhD subunit
MGASPLGAGLLLGVVALASAVVAIKLAAALVAVPNVYAPFLEVLSAIAMVGGGLGAIAARSPRARLTYLAASQVGWVAAGLATHYRVGIGASLFLLGAFALAATCGPAVLGSGPGAGHALAGRSAAARWILRGVRGGCGPRPKRAL